MRKVLLALLAGALLATAGCSLGAGDDDDAESAPLTPPELGWIRAYADLTIDAYDDDLGAPAGSRLVEICRERIDELGPPPTDRLEPAAELVETMCPLLDRRGTHRRALDVVDAADALLRPLLRDEQELELRAGVTEGSRADPDLSAVAARGAGRPVEVRCWSESDWRRLIEEDNAWTASGDSPDELYGWADESADRVHMRLEQCNAVSRVRDESPWSERRGSTRRTRSPRWLTRSSTSFEDDVEAEVECAALGTLATVGQRVGLDPAAAREAAELYRTEVYPDLPDEYHGDCPAAP